MASKKKLSMDEFDIYDFDTSRKNGNSGRGDGTNMMNPELRKNLEDLEAFGAGSVVAGGDSQNFELNPELSQSLSEFGTMTTGSNKASSGRKRATRMQKIYSDDYHEVNERLESARNDRRAGWRATKSKGNRRNRRYENRIVKGVSETWGDDEIIEEE
eukprot:CAMPEP_0184482166 /NCGR_PEP_ID=MMETSP0113_2-20130426/3747_1 /TAXON_ID=91329 /ORGANISM="Norrisiella sphaerica, Strain BC52" /LENGTH=157 /DNA_ID=CAMNT_0026861755 /DNA_START=368 /DNA_END=841 /DNA_ORIENTATION=-